MSENSIVWADESRAGVDASMIRARRKAERVNAEAGESCPDCGYIISAISFPEICAYCGSSF
jgi:rubrerythrin